MTGSERGFSGYALGGYRPDAGLTPAKAAGVQKIPVPSLLRSLLTEHLDPGYAAAAARRSAEPPAGRPRIPNWVWQALAALLIAAVFAAAMAQARSVAAGDRATQHGLAAGVKSAEVTVEQLTAQRNQLAAELDAVQRRQLDDDAEGRELLAALDGLTLAAAGAALIGPGLTVTVTEPANPPDLTDVSKQRVLGSQQVILDRDLQLVVNGLWAAGAEAVSVGGVRVGPAVTIRQAGGAILVDNHPITNPYAIVALGPPNTLRDGFESSSGMTRLQLLAASYGVGVGVQTDDALTVPAGTARELEFAKRSGS